MAPSRGRNPFMEHSFAVRECCRRLGCAGSRTVRVQMNHTRFLKNAAAVGTAVAIAISAANVAVAAPLGSGQLALKEAAPADVIDVGWRGRRNTAVALGVLGGLALGGALASPYYYGGYYPAYAAAPYPYPAQRCWIQTGPYRGQGYWGYC
jgi:hypothetical protein